MKRDIDIIVEALNYVATNAAYDTKGPDLLWKLHNEIQRIQDREDAMEKFSHEQAMREIQND